MTDDPRPAPPVRPGPPAVPAPPMGAQDGRDHVGLSLAVVFGLVAVLVVGFVVWAATRPERDELQVEEVVARLERAGTVCTLTTGPKLGSGGKPFAAAADDYWFAPCATADGQVFAVVTFDPARCPTEVPCVRAEGEVAGQGSWWIHQEHQGDAAGGLDVPQQVDRRALASIARQLDGRFVETC